MKKIIVAILIAAIATAVAGAKEPKVYINPGHGGWTGYDRPMPTIPYPNLSSTGRPDTCGFYESNTDLWKCEGLRDALVRMGMRKENLRMSRTVNGPYPATAERYTDISKHTGVIAAEAEEFAPDLFISVHSDAALRFDATENHTLFLYRGHDEAKADKDGADQVKGSLRAAKILWRTHYMDAIDPKSLCSLDEPNIRGDWDYYIKIGRSKSSIDTTYNRYSNIPYKGYLGALKHGYPGVLVEGFCHTYAPARHRALNRDYCRQEGVRLARGIAKLLKLKPEKIGYIMGTVKNGANSLERGDRYIYRKGSVDTYEPINGATVTLYKGSKQVATYRTDQNYNGVFVFEGLAPAEDYYISVSADGYQSLAKEGPFTVTANETTYPLLYLYHHQAPNKSHSSKGLKLKKAYADRSIKQLEGKTVRRALMWNGKIAVLAIDDKNRPTIVLIDPQKLTAGTVSTRGIDYNCDMPLNDIVATADGQLLGCNLAGADSEKIDPSESGHSDSLRIYRWEKHNALPTVWYTTADRCGWQTASVGNALAFDGTLNNGRLYISAVNEETTYYNAPGLGGVDVKDMQQIRILSVEAFKGFALTTERYTHVAGSQINASNCGYDFKMQMSLLHPRALVIDGCRTTPIELQVPADNEALTLAGRVCDNNVIGSMSTLMEHEGATLLFCPSTHDNRTNCGIAVSDVSQGFDAAAAIDNAGATLPAMVVNFAGTLNDGDAVYLLRDNRLSKFTLQ